MKNWKMLQTSEHFEIKVRHVSLSKKIYYTFKCKLVGSSP